MICTRVSALPQAQRAGRKASVYKVSLNKEVPHSPSPMAPKKPSPAIKKGAKVLVVGAGRIGCELLKTLALSGCQDIHIIDMGLIKVGDLNGQFLFRQLDVGKSKASVARCVVLKFWPHISITPYHACVEHPHFGAGFFAQFDVVLNALDNFEAKRHVNRQCLAYDVPLIESWTAGFLGQVTVHVKRQTKCYECQPKSAPEMHHVCSTTSTSSEVLRHGLFESNEIVGNIGPAVEATNAIIAGLIVIETVKVLQNDTKNYRMTYCSVHPTKKMLLMPVKPFEPNKSCYVCSETPLSLEINTKRAKLRDIVEKIVKNKLGMNSPIIRHGAAALYKFGGCRDTPKMRINYDVNLDKVLSELPSPVTSGTMLTIVDLQQDLSCIFNFKHREEFDEEKEPDGMVLSGLIQATSVLMDDKKSNDDSGSTSSASELEADEDSEIECAPGKKRKRSEVSGADMSSVAGDTTSHGKLEIGDEISNGKRSRSEDPAREPHHLRTLPDDCAAAPSLSNKGFKSIKPKPSLVVGGEGCRICGHDHHHTVHCPFLDYLPPGTTVGPDYLVICCICGSELPQPAPKWCVHCCEQGGRAVEASTIKFFDEDWRHHHPERFWGPDESEDVCI